MYKPVTTAQIAKINALISRLIDKGMNYAEIEYNIAIFNNKLVRNFEDLTQSDASGIIDGLINLLDDTKIKKRAKSKVNNPVSPAQIKKIHVLLQQKGLMEEKATMVHSMSEGRTQSTKELSCCEAKRLIAFLMDENAEIQMKMKNIYLAIWKLAWETGIIYGETDDDYQMNKAKLNIFCRTRGSVKKNLTEMNLSELQKIHRQFEAIYNKYKRNKKETE